MCDWWQVPALGRSHPSCWKPEGLVGWRQSVPTAPPRCPQNVMSVCVFLIHPLPAASFHRHAPPQTPSLSNVCWFVFACSWTEMRGIDALCECRDEREGRCVAGLRGGRGPRQCRWVGGGALSSWRLWVGRQDVWSGQSVALAAPLLPPPSRSRTRGRPHWGWTLSLHGAHIFHLEGWIKRWFYLNTVLLLFFCFIFNI